MLKLRVDPDLVDKNRVGDGRATESAVEEEELFGAGGVGDLLIGTEDDGTGCGPAGLRLGGGIEAFAG
jgi:hypothetical protein